MKPLVNKKYKLEKFPGKGGWTFARIPEVMQDGHSPFGWLKVHVTINGVEIKKYRLMPMGDGHLFLPVRADIRKKIGKKEGDVVHIVLYRDDDPVEVPEEMLLCLQDEPAALAFFNALPEGEKVSHIKRIYSAKSEEEKVTRLAKMINLFLDKGK